MKNEAKGAKYDNLMKSIQKTARQLKVDLRKDFGAKPIVTRPNIVDTAIAANSFSVRSIFYIKFALYTLDISR